ncbi:MAG: asparagine synthase (glutamine-hydrolyzing) [Clostridiales bacterium]|nr:asparagine synthase (glutamine-hydrolyzing) [Clostridiales bacterium]
MCGICGYINFREDYTKNKPLHQKTVHEMAKTMRMRGPDEWGEYIDRGIAFAHTRLSVIDPEKGKQPMRRCVSDYDFVITYNGELYNTEELRRDLELHGYHFTTGSDTEVLLYTYIHYGEECAQRLNGIFAFAIYDSMRRQVFLCRDRFGIKPLFYAGCGDTIVFGSEIKALFAYPGIEPALDREGLCELFGMSPARTQGRGVYKGICELRPGRFMIVGRRGIKIRKYYELKSRPHTDSYDKTIQTVRELVYDSIKRQLVSDVPLAAFLSGGLDSSIVSAVGAIEMKKKNKRLCTYSFDYEDNDRYFKPSSFQPDSDSEWVPKMVEFFGTEHTRLVCPNYILTNYLRDALVAKDLPGMADCDASLIYYCRQVKKHHTVALSGEASDEIFGGYPWFRDPKAFESRAFPWCYDLDVRKNILLPEVRDILDLDGYYAQRYEESICEVPVLEGESAEEKRRREISYLNIIWFMSNLLDRKDRMSMAAGLEVRVPFCDHRLVDYVWNIPWSMKNKNNVSKNVLREAAAGILPEDVRQRKKSPYPKTHNPEYEKAVKAMLGEIIADPSSPILALCDKKRLKTLLDGSFDYSKPFFGQLMAMPQFIGYIIQLNYLFEIYNPRIL